MLSSNNHGTMDALWRMEFERAASLTRNARKRELEPFTIRRGAGRRLRRSDR